jgi:histone-lysine N-methyltransferase SUV39H
VIQGITAEELARCHHCQLLNFSNRKEYPIYLKGARDDQPQHYLPVDFTFIEESILHEGVERAEPEFRSGCDCFDAYQCQREGCSCLQDMVYEEPGPDNKIYAYHSTNSRRDCLRSEILESRDPIYECHSGCVCGEDCRNRVVERGRKIPLDLFYTTDGRGWGKCLMFSHCRLSLPQANTARCLLPVPHQARSIH